MRFFVVLGPWRGGTSACTGVLQSLGVDVGDEFFAANTGYCTYEDTKFRSACLDCFGESQSEWGYKQPFQKRVEILGNWLRITIQRTKQTSARAFGAKHPVICRLITELDAACAEFPEIQLVPILVRRSADQILGSWDRGQSDWWGREDRKRAVRELIQSRDLALAGRPHVTMSFDYLRADPLNCIVQFARDCGLQPQREQIERAVSIIRCA